MKRLSFMAIAGLLSSVSCTPIALGCDRTCLVSTLEQQLSQWVSQGRTSGIAPDFSYIENGVETPLEDAFWHTATALGGFQRYYADPQTGDAVYFGLVEEPGSTDIVSLRIRYRDGQAIDGESIVVRKGSHNFYSPEGLAESGPADAVLASQPATSRAAMIAAADSYFDGIQTQNPDIVLNHRGCVRVENGVKVTQYPGTPPSLAFTDKDCTANISGMKQIAEVVDREYVVDEQAAMVLGRVVFNRHPGAKLADGSPRLRLLVMEYFSVRGDRFDGVYAAMQNLPHGQLLPWDVAATGNAK
ncbi:MAG: hypothetical protein H6978_15160 [Gammaproteobacteria bacterium]|nr:hypothetical protein [Gammaproteobacteria bacterium]